MQSTERSARIGRVPRLLAGSGTLMLTLLLSPSSAVSGTAVERSTNAPIDHTIVIFLENHTFDNLYGRFPGANGLDQPGARVPQVDKDGVVYQTLPQPIDASKNPPEPDSRFPTSLPNTPFWINEYISLDEIAPSPVHRFYQHQLQIDGGNMDKYVAWTD
jgi:phospholipase C